MKRAGFTFLEVMVVLACMIILLVPTWMILRQGTRSSLQGMLQIDTSLEGRRLLKQVTNDLKQACWTWDDENRAVYYLEDILPAAGGSFPDAEFSFLAFPHTGKIEDAISPTPDAGSKATWRLPNRITYRLEKSKGKTGFSGNFPIYNLIREERFNPRHPDSRTIAGAGNKITHVLSDRVLFFEILPYTIADQEGTARQFFWITLKLVDTLNRSTTLTVPDARDQVSGPSKDLAIASFFEIACPEYLASYRQMAGKTLDERSSYNRVTFFDPMDPGQP